MNPVLAGCLLASAVVGAPASASEAERPSGIARRAEPLRKPRVVYGGDARFAPYDYLDAGGRATGFSVELVRALARDAGVDLEVHLGSWHDARADLDGGRVDLLSLSYSDDRAESYAWLAKTWTMQQCVLLRPG